MINKGNVIKRGDVIQIINQDHEWYPCFLMVNEVNARTVLAFLLFPSDDGVKQAYMPLAFEEFEKIGTASVIPARFNDNL